MEKQTTKFTCIPKLGQRGGGKVWDKDSNKVIAAFDASGNFETSDEQVIQKLRNLGFRELQSGQREEPDHVQRTKTRKTSIRHDHADTEN